MYYLIDKQEKLDRVEVGMSPVSLDIECTGLDIFKDKIKYKFLFLIKQIFSTYAIGTAYGAIFLSS